MKTRRMVTSMLTIIFILSLLFPTSVFAKSASNDFTTKLTVSDTSVKAGTTVTCSIKVTNSDPKFAADVVVQTSSGSTVQSFSLGPLQSRTVTDSKLINNTTAIYYKVYASHGPDISKTKNTNTVTVSVEQKPTSTPTPSTPPDAPAPMPDMEAEMPEFEYEPIRGIPTSGSIYTVSIVNIQADGIDLGGTRYMVEPSQEFTISGEIHYNLPDSVFLDYWDRVPSEYAYINLIYRDSSSSGLFETVRESFEITDDSGIISISQTFSVDIDTPITLTASLGDPINDASISTWDRVFVHIGSPIDEYEMWVDQLYVNGVLVEPGDTVDIAYNEQVTISQMIHYRMPESELALESLARADIMPRIYIEGLGGADYERVWIIPEAAEGEYLIEAVIPSYDLRDDILSGGINRVDIDVLQRRTGFRPHDINHIVSTVNLNVRTAVDWGEPVEEPRAEATLLGGFMQMGLIDWLGLDFGEPDASIDLTPAFPEFVIHAPGDYGLTGLVEFSGPENTSVRISGSEGFGDPLLLERFTAEGTARYAKPIHVFESEVYNITAELLSEDGLVIASETQIVNVTIVEPPEEVDLRQRFSLIAAPQVIGLGHSTTIYYSVSNEYSGQILHVRLIDEEDGSIIFEDENFASFEIFESSLEKMPDFPTSYGFTVQVFDTGGTVIWEQRKETRVITVPNPVEDDGEETVFNLRLGSSRTEIVAGENVNIYGAIDYGSFDFESTIGELRVFATDQDDHVLFFNASVFPRDVMGFAETYALYETTTFSIIAEGVAADGVTVLSDRDTITITVNPAEEEAVPEEEPVYDIDFVAHASETVIGPGDSIDIELLVANIGTEDVDVVVRDTDDAVVPGSMGFLVPGSHTVSHDAVMLDESTMLRYQAMVWIDGTTLVRIETFFINIVVDEALAPEPEEPEGTYGIDLTLDISEHTINRGETVDILMNNLNTGTEMVDLIVYDTSDAVVFRAMEVRPDETITSYVYVDWRPEVTSTVILRAEAINDEGVVVATDSSAVTVTVIEPEEEPDISVDMVVSASETTVMLGQSVDIFVDVTNTGDRTVDFIVTESLEGSSFATHAVAPGGLHHEEILGWTPERTTTIIFVVRVLDPGGIVLYSDVESIIITVEEPMPDDADDGIGDGGADEGAGDATADDADTDDADHGDDDADEPRGLFDSDGFDDVGGVEEMSSDGMSVTLTSLISNADSDNGSIILIESNDDSEDSNIFKQRRWLFAGAMVIAILIIVLLILLIVLASKKRKKGSVDAS